MRTEQNTTLLKNVIDWINFSNKVPGTDELWSLTGGLGGERDMWTATAVVRKLATFMPS